MTGFLGKVLLEEIFRKNWADHVYVLVRPDNRSTHSYTKEACDLAKKRFEKEVLQSPCFENLNRKSPDWKNRVTVLAGDICFPYCGISPSCRETLKEVTRVIHCAATVEFDLPLRDAANLNILGTQNILELSRCIPQLRKLTYISTAYVSPMDGEGEPILEKKSRLRSRSLRGCREYLSRYGGRG